MRIGENNSLMVSDFDGLSFEQQQWIQLRKNDLINALHYMSGYKWVLKKDGVVIAEHDDFYWLKVLASGRGWTTRLDFKTYNVGIYRNPFINEAIQP